MASLALTACNLVSPTSGAIRQIARAQRLASDTSDPKALPPADAEHGWQIVQLPDGWPGEQPAGTTAYWYRVSFQARAPLADEALHVRVLTPAALYAVNGRVVSITPEMQSRSGAAKPVQVPLPRDALREGDNELLVRLSVLPDRAAYLGSLRIGPAAEVEAEYERFIFFKRTLRQAVVVAALLLAVVLASIWSARRGELLYLLFALVCLGWAHQTHNYYASAPPWPEPYWGISIALGDYLTESLMCLFVLRYTDLLRRWHVLALAAYVLLSFGITIRGGLSDTHWWWDWYSQPWEYTPFAISALYMALLVWHAWRTRRGADALMALACVLMIAASWRDTAPFSTAPVSEELALTPYAYGIVIAVFSARLVRRFIDSVAEAEALNHQLEGRIAERTQEIRRSLEALAV
ncbi:MAG TPA: hypothetical protein VFV25_12490, partial [Methylibium sp.]